MKKCNSILQFPHVAQCYPDANCAIITKRVKLQHEKKPISNLISMQSVGFEQTSMIFIEIFVLQE